MHCQHMIYCYDLFLAEKSITKESESQVTVKKSNSSSKKTAPEVKPHLIILCSTFVFIEKLKRFALLSSVLID